MIRSNMRGLRPSGQIDASQIAATVDNFQDQAGFPGLSNTEALALNPNSPFSQVGLSWSGTPPDLQRQLVGNLLVSVGVFNTTTDYQGAVAQEITNRLRQVRLPTGPSLNLTCEQWRAMDMAAKRGAVSHYFARSRVSYLFVRPVDYDYVIGGNNGTGGINGTCPAPAPAHDPTATPSTTPTIVRVTVTFSSALPNDASVMLGNQSLHRTGPNTFESGDLPTEGPTAFTGAHAQLVVTGTGIQRREQRVDIAPHATTEVSIPVLEVCPTPPSFSSEDERSRWVDRYYMCPVPGPYVAPCPTPPAFTNEPDRQAWIAAHPGCPTPPAANCPTAPTTWASVRERKLWIEAHSACPPPPAYVAPCPTPPTSWSSEAERTEWIAAHAGCQAAPYCPALPASFASEAARQTWIDAHSGCAAPVWSAPSIVPVAPAKKSNFWKWLGFAAVVGGAGYAYKTRKSLS